MKFLVDANLPNKLAKAIGRMGHTVIHTDDLPNKEKTSDKEIKAISKDQNLVVISKDTDFFDSHLIQGVPPKFLFVSTGNITNKELFKLFEKNFENIVTLFETYDLIDIDNQQIVVYENQ